MLILTLRTDKPEAEIGLYDGEIQLAYGTWQAHRQLSDTIHTKITAMLASHSKSLHDLEGIACYKGPGSFTGLRIGMSVANALAHSLKIPALAGQGEEWQVTAVRQLQAGKSESVMLPDYGGDVAITKQKK